MNPVNHRIASAVGAALLLSSGAAFAAPYTPTSNTDADYVVHWGGATASTLSAQELVQSRFCGGIGGAFANTTSYGSNGWYIACTLPVATAGLPANARLLVVKRDLGGSITGVWPLQNAGPIMEFPQINAGGTLTFNATATLGTADIEPNKFIGINCGVVDGVTRCFDPALPTPNLTVTGALVFNTPVTLALRDALQRAQFPASSVCNPDNASYNASTGQNVANPNLNPARPITNGESQACMPSLTRQEIASILNGRIVLWSQLLGRVSVSAPDAATGRPTDASTALAGAVQICRRSPGSGTQAQANAFFNNFPCDYNAAPDNSLDLIPPRTANPPTNTVTESGSSGAVDTCLHNANASANPYAIGILSVERNLPLAGAALPAYASNWRYIKVDGVAPTLENVHGGNYFDWAQQACMHRGGSVEAAICAELNAPARLAVLQNEYTWGVSGWLASATTVGGVTTLYDNLFAKTNPVNAYTRETSIGRTNACINPVKSSAGGNAGRGTIVGPNPQWTGPTYPAPTP